jgi:hypothetical protein
MGRTLEEVNGEIDAIERRIGEMWGKVRELREVRRILEEKSDEDHLSNPRPGDLWHDLFSPVLVVLGVESETVAICDKAIPYAEGETAEATGKELAFDLDRVRKIPRAEFESMLKRKSNGGLTRHCIPGRAEGLVRMWAEKQ